MPRARQHLRRRLGDVLAKMRHRALILIRQAVHGFDKRAFAAAVGPEHDDDLSSIRAQRHAVDDRHVAVAGMQILHHQRPRRLRRRLLHDRHRRTSARLTRSVSPRSTSRPSPHPPRPPRRNTPR